MLLDDLGDLLSSAGLGTVGTSLFLGYSPEQPDAMVTVYETGGLAPIRAMTATAGVIIAERPGVQVVTRAVTRDYAEARRLAHRAFVVVEGLGERTINGRRYLYAETVQSPFLMGRDEAGRVLIAFNAIVTKELSTTS